MKIVHNIKRLSERRKNLRNNSTPEEILLWIRLKNSQTGFKWRRQHSIGGYITDFYCPEKKLVVEIDGPQHLERENKEYDAVRLKFLEGLDIKVLRFKNKEIATETERVVRRIQLALTTPNPS